MPREIDYALARRAIIRDYRGGVLHRLDVCDAHPELVRSARNLGRPSDVVCPVCADSEGLKYVSYAYSDALKVGNGRVIADANELRKLARSYDEVKCYDVEVCLACSWNFLVRTFVVGRRASTG